jgi:uncharacterized repeat protein (TIGR04138 family)
MEQFERAVRADGRYPPAAFEFLQRGLELATRARHGDEPRERGRGRHVTGQQLAHALRILAAQQWGPLAREVLRHWNTRRTRDFGEMVYLLIEIGLMGKQDSDHIADFDDVYDFETAFDSYRIELDDPSTASAADGHAQDTAD